MTLRLVHRFVDDNGIRYIIYIFDAESGLSYEYFATSRGSIVITDEGDDTDPYKRIVPKHLEFTMLLNWEKYTEAESAVILEFYNGLISAYEGRYYVALLEDGITGAPLFVGKIISDVGELQATYIQEVKITAVCGISGLKNVQFRPTDYDDTVPAEMTRIYQFTRLFRDILRYNDVSKIFYEGSPIGSLALFTTSSNWTDIAMGSGNMFEQLYMRNHYYEEISKTYRKYDNCYDVLHDLLTGFNARMYWANGSWHIEQLGYQDNATVLRYRYNYAGDLMGTIANKTTHNITTNDDIKVLVTPSVKRLAPLKAVALTQNKQYNNILSGMDINYPDNPGPHNLGYAIGAGNELIHDLSFELDVSSAFTANAVYLYFELEIKIGDYYLKSLLDTNPTGYNNWDIMTNTPTIQSKPVNLKPFAYEWTLTSSTLRFVAPIQWALAWGVGSTYVGFKNIHIIGNSNTILDDGDFIITLLDVGVKDFGGSDVAVDTAKITKWYLTKGSRILIVTNGLDGLVDVPEDTVIYEVGDSRNTMTYEASLSFFDSQGFDLKQLYTVQSAVVLRTSLWTDTDMGETLPIQQLVMLQMLAMRSVPAKVIKCVLIRKDGVIGHMSDRYAWSGQQHIPLKSVHTVDIGNYALSLWEVYKDFPGVNVFNISKDPDVIFRYQPVDVSSESAARQGVEYFEEWTNIATAYVELTDFNLNYVDLTDENEIKIKYHFYINGVRQRYIDATPANRTFQFDVDNNRINLFKGSGNVIHAEFLKYY